MVETIELSQKSEKEALQNKIEVKSVHFSYGETEILQDINLEVKEGEFLVLMGPSGSGKSTLLRMLANLSQPKSGQILFDSPLDLAVVFQDYSLFPWLTAEENIVLALKKPKPKKSYSN